MKEFFNKRFGIKVPIFLISIIALATMAVLYDLFFLAITIAFIVKVTVYSNFFADYYFILFIVSVVITTIVAVVSIVYYCMKRANMVE